jgi:two-component system chemotaxis sensor kinase CheA
VDELVRRADEGAGVAAALHQTAESVAANAEAMAQRLRIAAHRGVMDGRHEDADLLAGSARLLTGVARDLETSDRTAQQASAAVLVAAQQLRTQPFADACSTLDRVVRDVGEATGKQARLLLRGGDVDVDRAVVAALRDPLLHLVRNAVDHGIESPAARGRAGKPERGLVEVTATVDGSSLTVTVRDDGAGVDVAGLRAAAARRGVAVPAADEHLALQPGLSIRSEVTAVSGRGVGLDAARSRLEKIGGSLAMSSRPGSGTSVVLTAPVSLAVMRVLLVQVLDQVVALPTTAVERVTAVPVDSLYEVEGAVLLTSHGRSVRAISLAGALGLGTPPPSAHDGQMQLVVARGQDAALVTDGVLQETELSIRPIPARLEGAPAVVGIAAAPGERALLVVNPAVLSRGVSAPVIAAGVDQVAEKVHVLVAEDTMTTRALERSMLLAAGYAVSTAVDGADAWEQLQLAPVDLLVSDVDMPRLNGIELCRRIRSTPSLRDLPVVLVTSLDSPEDRRRGLEAGADAYVVKSDLHQGTLVDAVARLL